MKNLINKIKAKQKIIMPILAIVLFALLITTICTKKRVSFGQEYTDRNSVALYIMEYRELPSNYITMYGFDYIEDKEKYKDEVSKKVIGGDTHWNNEDTLRNKGINEQVSLKECDIKGDDGKYILPKQRGKKRLVYTTNLKEVRVFYTEDHYKNYDEINKFKIMPAYYIFLILFIIDLIMTFTLILIVYGGEMYKFIKNKKNIYLDKKGY